MLLRSVIYGVTDVCESSNITVCGLDGDYMLVSQISL